MLSKVSVAVAVLIHIIFFLSLSFFKKNQVTFQDEIFVDIVGSELVNAGSESQKSAQEPSKKPKPKKIQKQAEEVFSDKPVENSDLPTNANAPNSSGDNSNSESQGSSDDAGFASGSGQLSRAPKKLYEVKPKYPQSARVKGIEGTVSLRIYINKDGKVVKADLVNGLGDEFNAAAVEAALKTIFSPALDKSGQPIGIRILYKFRFNLEE